MSKATPSLFDVGGAFALWFRAPGRGQRWKRVGTFATQAEAIDAMRGSGGWLILPVGRKP